MPDLPGSTPEKDKAMFYELYHSDKYQPDQMKVYPCEVVPWTVIEKWYKSGKYKPYGEDKVLIQDVISYSMSNCPPWIRLPRVMRDIPEHYISAGLKCGNMRQNIEGKNGFIGKDIRSREIGRHPQYMLKYAKLFVRKYKASNGTEYFISFESKDNIALFGFCRLRIIHTKHNIHSVYDSTLYNMGLIRELHVYGSLVGVNQVNETNMQGIQHSGIGKKLIKKAEQITLYNHFKRGTIVISGIGVRGYYEKMGYSLRNNYMTKHFVSYKYCLIIIGIILGLIYDTIVTLITIYFAANFRAKR